MKTKFRGRKKEGSKERKSRDTNFSDERGQVKNRNGEDPDERQQGKVSEVKGNRIGDDWTIVIKSQGKEAVEGRGKKNEEG